jgi:hypothetical protein
MKGTCDIYGKLDDIVYRRQAIGELWEYDNEYIPKHPATVLSSWHTFHRVSTG